MIEKMKHEIQFKTLSSVEKGNIQACKTYIRNMEIFDYHNNLIIETRVKYRDVAQYIPMGYYHDKIAEHFKLTPNYVCSILSAMSNIGEVRRMALLRKSEICIRD